jgi:lipid-binding SYLF domain-containing protein
MSFNGQVIGVRETLNVAFFSKPVTPVDILVTRTVTNAEADPLRAALKAMAR